MQKLLLKASQDLDLIINTFKGAAKSDYMLGKFYQLFLKRIKKGIGHDSMILLRGDYFVNDDNQFKLIEYNLVSVSLASHTQNYQKAR